MKVSSSATRSFLTSPPPEGIRAILIHGGDAGKVREAARAILSATGANPESSFGATILYEDDLAADPSLLSAEALTASLTGERPPIWVRGAGRRAAEAISRLLRRDDLAECSMTVIESAALAKDSKLRKECEASSAAAAVALYEDADSDRLRLIDEICSRDRVSLDESARTRLAELLPPDRLAARSEIEKLALYVGEGGAATLDDVDALCGDAAQRSVGDAVDAAFNRDPDAVDAALRRLDDEGVAAASILASALSHHAVLTRLRAEVEAGASPLRGDVVVASSDLLQAARDGDVASRRVGRPIPRLGGRPPRSRRARDAIASLP